MVGCIVRRTVYAIEAATFVVAIIGGALVAVVHRQVADRRLSPPPMV